MGNDFKDLFGDWNPEDGPPPISDTGELHERPELPPDVLREVRVVNVYEATTSNGEEPKSAPLTFVLLRDRSGRELRIFMLYELGLSIKHAIEGNTSDRPATHDLMRKLMDVGHVVVDSVTIDDLWHETFYARVTVSSEGRQYDIDARPSDAIAIGLRFHAPIYVADRVLEAVQAPDEP